MAVGQVLAGLAPRLATIDLAGVQRNMSNFLFLQEKLGDPFINALKNRLIGKIHKLST